MLIEKGTIKRGICQISNRRNYSLSAPIRPSLVLYLRRIMAAVMTIVSMMRGANHRFWGPRITGIERITIVSATKALSTWIVSAALLLVVEYRKAEMVTVTASRSMETRYFGIC